MHSPLKSCGFSQAFRSNGEHITLHHLALFPFPVSAITHGERPSPQLCAPTSARRQELRFTGWPRPPHSRSAAARPEPGQFRGRRPAGGPATCPSRPGAPRPAPRPPLGFAPPRPSRPAPSLPVYPRAVHVVAVPHHWSPVRAAVVFSPIRTLSTRGRLQPIGSAAAITQRDALRPCARLETSVTRNEWRGERPGGGQ